MSHTTLRKSLLNVVVVTCLLLIVPAVAMRFTNEVSWDVRDFAVAAVLLFAAGTGMVVAARSFNSRIGRVAAIAIVALAFLLVWAELAVGLFH